MLYICFSCSLLNATKAFNETALHYYYCHNHSSMCFLEQWIPLYGKASRTSSALLPLMTKSLFGNYIRPEYSDATENVLWSRQVTVFIILHAVVPYSNNRKNISVLRSTQLGADVQIIAFADFGQSSRPSNCHQRSRHV